MPCLQVTSVALVTNTGQVTLSGPGQYCIYLTMPACLKLRRFLSSPSNFTATETVLFASESVKANREKFPSYSLETKTAKFTRHLLQVDPPLPVDDTHLQVDPPLTVYRHHSAG